MDLLWRLAVVAEVVVAGERFFFVVDFKYGRGEGIDHQGDDSGGIALKRQLGHA